MTPAAFASLMRLRPRARAASGERQTEAVDGFSFTWMCRRLPTRALHGEELLGVESPDGFELDAHAFVSHLPDALVPHEVKVDGRRTVFRFRVQEGRFRCRDCGWGEASDQKASYNGFCSTCSDKRREAVWGWRGEPQTMEE